MEENIMRLVWAVAPSIIVGVFMAYFNYQNKKREEKVEARAEMRKKESLLQLKMQFANGKLAYATAKAYKNGRMNGELDEGEKAYQEAIADYNRFVNESHQSNLLKED